MPSILSQRTTSTRTTQIIIDVGVSLFCFRYPATLKKSFTRNVIVQTTFFQTMFLSKNCPFPYKENKSKEFYCRCYVVKLFLYFSFFIFPPFQCLSCISCYVKNFFVLKVAHIFLVILFSILRRAIYNTRKSH